MLRVPLAAVLLAACSFETRSLTPGAPDAPTDAAGTDVAADATGPDASGIDAVALPDAAAADALMPDVVPPSDAPLPDASSCVPECADEDTLRTCPTGELVGCALGCVPTGTPHCGVLVPSNGATADMLDGTLDLTVPAGQTYIVQTDTGEIVSTTGGTVRDPGTGVFQGIGYYVAGNAAVVSARSLTVEGTLRPLGVRPLIVLAGGDAIIRGLVNVAAGTCATLQTPRWCAGPGGGVGGRAGAPATGCGPGGPGVSGGSIDETGGGGGGFGGPGMPGGNANNNDLGGSAGAACGTDALVPLVGGSGGGKGGSGGNGGGGGGGLQITSYTRIVVEQPPGVTVGITAGGAGGGNGNNNDGGGGGGSGGAILLEAPSIVVGAGVVLAANGGGGGAGNGGADGSFAALSAAPAPGGPGGQPGGQGGAALGAPVAGTGGARGTGAGGAGVGRIRINSRTIQDSGATVSPTASQGMLMVE